MNFMTWRWGFYFTCPLFACGGEISRHRQNWQSDFVKWNRGGLLLAWQLR